MSDSPLEIVVEEPVKEVLAGLAAYRQAAGGVCARLQATLDRRTDGDVFLLNLLADLDAGQVARARRVRDIREVEVENDLGSVHASWNHQIGIHGVAVAV